MVYGTAFSVTKKYEQVKYTLLLYFNHSKEGNTNNIERNIIFQNILKGCMMIPS